MKHKLTFISRAAVTLIAAITLAGAPSTLRAKGGADDPVGHDAKETETGSSGGKKGGKKVGHHSSNSSHHSHGSSHSSGRHGSSHGSGHR